MAEERTVEGVIVSVGGGQWTTKALIQTDDGTRVEASFRDIDQELVDPERFRTGTRIRLDVPARYTSVRQENLDAGRPPSYEVPARPPFAHPRQAEWIDGAGRAHPLVRDVGHQAEDIHPGWDQVEGHPIYSDPQGPYGDRIAAREANRTSILNETESESERIMTSVGKKTVQGNLTGDPRQVQTKAGQKLVVFKMAENHRRYDEADQQWKDAEPTFYDVAVDRERLAANVLNSVHKGDRVTVAGNYQVDAYATSTGEPGLNHRIWAEEVAASLQHNQVEIIPRDRSRDDPDRWLGQTADQGVQSSAPAASSAQTASSGVSHVDPGTAPGVRPEEVTPEAYAAWSAQQGPLYAQTQQQGVSGPGR